MAALTGFPTRLDGPMTWTGSDYDTKPERYVMTLSQTDIQDINRAISHFKGTSSVLLAFLWET